MPIPSTPPRAYAELFALERARLLELLRGCTPDDWLRPTPCPAWSVLGLTLHLLGDDFSLLAGHRDGHQGTSPPAGQTDAEFVDWLDALMMEWVHAARRLSPRLTIDLLAWTGPQVVDLVASEDPTARTAYVTWASDDAVPVWLDHARELSERWIHRQQLLEALHRESDLHADLAEPVLDGLRWAYPFRLAPLTRPAGTTVEIESQSYRWHIVSDGNAWQFAAEAADQIVAALRATDEQLWRLLTNNLRREHGDVATTGDGEITTALLRTRAIIGTPK